MNNKIKSTKEFIEGILMETGREGINNLLFWMENGSDFYTAPCSTQFHLAEEGGLAQHSINVYDLLKFKVSKYDLPINPASIAICGLCHDLCKTNFYTKGTKNVKENGIWQEKEIWIVKDQFPFGHGEKSVSILQDFISLTYEEECAIRWHMVAFDAGIHFSYPSGFAFREVSNRYPLVTLLFTADYEASQIIEANPVEAG